jgi:cytochrome c-type biogenesis protein CcmH
MGPGVCAAEDAGQAVEEPVEAAPDAPLLGAEKEAIAQQIFNELVSPCCWTTTVAQHGSGKAPVIQAEVRQMLASGMGKPAILEHYIQEYGERILAKPKKSGFNLAAYWVPYLAMLAGAGVIFVLVRRGIGRHRGPVLAQAPSGQAPAPSRAAPRPGTDEAYRQQLDEEIRKSR